MGLGFDRPVLGINQQVLVDLVGMGETLPDSSGCAIQIDLNCRNACMICGPYMRGRNSARACPVAVLARDRSAVLSGRWPPP